MEHLTPQETCSMFLALKFHFTQKGYDYFKYKGKTRKRAFDTKKDKGYYIKLSRRYDKNQMLEFFISNLIKGKRWIGDLIEDDAKDNYTEYIRRKQSLTYSFESELDGVLKFVPAKDIFKSRFGQYPEIMQAYLSGELSLESLTILNEFFCFDAAFDTKLGKNDPIWSTTKLLMQKMLPFIQYDKEKIRIILRNRFINT